MSAIAAPICFRSFKRAEQHRPSFWCVPVRIAGSRQRSDHSGTCEGVVRTWPATASRPFQVPASHGRTARSTVVQLAFGPVTVLPPRLEKRCDKEPLLGWAIRVWEEQTPDGEEPLEWILVTSASTTTHGA